MPQPNILFIMSDQHRGDALSIAGHPTVLTPHMDSLGASGAFFRRAYSTCPSCIPARRALLTGKHPANNGVTGYVENIPIPPSYTTMPRALRDAGYQTVLVGRAMHQSPAPARHGYDQVISGSCYLQDDVYAREVQASVPGGIRSIGLTNNGYDARPWPHPEQLHPTTWIFNQSRDFLKQADTTAPLFLNVSTYAPHPPLLPPRDYFERYLRTGVDAPAIGTWATPPDPKAIQARGTESARCNIKGDALLACRAGYYGLINHLDDQLYWLINEFKSHSRQHNRPVLIVYTSDHGEMLGDHYLFRKCEPYEGSANIPLLIHGSHELGFNPGTICNTPVCLEDLMPTFLDLAGAPHPAGLDGKSLLPILTGQSPSVRQTLHFEHAPCYSKEQAFHALTDGHHKFIWRPFTGAEQLFDIQSDPLEKQDLLQNGQNLPLAHQWRNKLIAQLQSRPEGFVQNNQLTPVTKWSGVA
jgi:arylsulfatase